MESDERARYDELIAREAAHWGAAEHDPDNPQLWDEPELRALALDPNLDRLVDRAASVGGPALELGCGEGDLALAIARRGVEITGIDLSEARVARGREHAKQQGLERLARFETGDLNQRRLPERTYACVIAHDALHHILELDDLLDRVARALRPGGTLLVSDFRGAGWLEKIATAAAVAILPTRQSYATKWRLRGRLRALLASERSKREALARGGAETLHDASPFEGVSQDSIEPAIRRRFEIVERVTFCPFWYNAVPKLRMPMAWKRSMLSGATRLDAGLHRRGWTQGAYLFIEARAR